MKLKNFLAACVFTLSLGAGATRLHAQGIITGQLSGTVQDPTGAVVPGATITATNVALGQSFKATANASGEFSLGSLPVGQYRVTIAHAGFADTKVDNVTIETGKTTGLGVEKIAAGAIETVEVSTAQSLLETTQSQVTTTFDTEQIQNLPTGGGFDELALLIPGVVSTHGNNRANTNGAGISSNGQRGRSNNFEIDGQSNNDNSVTGPQVFFSNPDAIQEIQIITNNFSAQYGRDAGSVINYITKSGTNQIHGTASYQYEGSWLSSLLQGQKSPLFGYCPKGVAAGTNGCVAAFKPRFDDNIFAATLGGPILKDRLFGFGSGLIGRLHDGVTQSNSGTIGQPGGFIPTALGLQQLQAAAPGNAGVNNLLLFGPQAIPLGKFFYIGQPVTVNVTPVAGGPVVPVQFQQYARTINPSSQDEEVLGRIDYQATRADRLFIRYFYQNEPSFEASGTVSTGGLVNVSDVTYSVGADETHTFGPRVVNQIRYSFQQAKIAFDGGAFPSLHRIFVLLDLPLKLLSSERIQRLPAFNHQCGRGDPLHQRRLLRPQHQLPPGSYRQGHAGAGQPEPQLRQAHHHDRRLVRVSELAQRLPPEHLGRIHIQRHQWPAAAAGHARPCHRQSEHPLYGAGLRGLLPG